MSKILQSGVRPSGIQLAGSTATLVDKEGYLVKHDGANGIALCAADTDRVAGVVIDGADGSAGDLTGYLPCVPGQRARVKAAAAIAVGQEVSPDANGAVAESAAADLVAGIVVEASTSASSVVIEFVSPYTAA